MVSGPVTDETDLQGREAVFGELKRLVRAHWPILLLLAASLAPAFAVRIPAMLDYPNHLSRMYLLSPSSETPANPFYVVHWTFTTNLAMDLAVPPLASLIGVEPATKAFYLLGQILLVSGAMALERKVKGRIHLSPYVAGLFLCAAPFAWGFVNFEFGLGVALWATGFWLASERQAWPIRALAHAAFVVVLFVSHFFALGLYGATVGLHELWRLRSGRASWRDAAATFVILAAPVVVLIALLRAQGGAIGEGGVAFRLAVKPFWPFAVANGYSLTLSAIDMAALLSAAFLLWRRGCMRFVESGAWISIGLLLLYALMPEDLLGGRQNSPRMLAAAIFVAPAFVATRAPNLAWRRAIHGLALALVAANVLWAGKVWIDYREDYAAMLASFAKIAPGSKVIVAQSYSSARESTDPVEAPIVYAPSLAAAFSGALVSDLFTYPGDRPIVPRPQYKALAGQINPLSIDAMLSDSAPKSEAFSYLRAWRTDFDYVYVIGPHVPNPAPQLLAELADGTRFTLYGIAKASSAAPQSDR